MGAFLSILSALPQIIAAIKAVEAAVPGQGAGKQKLDTVISIITTLESSLGGMIPQLVTVIGHLVGLFNTTGTFTAAAAPVPAVIALSDGTVVTVPDLRG